MVPRSLWARALRAMKIDNTATAIERMHYLLVRTPLPRETHQARGTLTDWEKTRFRNCPTIQLGTASVNMLRLAPQLAGRRGASECEARDDLAGTRLCACSAQGWDDAVSAGVHAAHEGGRRRRVCQWSNAGLVRPAGITRAY